MTKPDPNGIDIITGVRPTGTLTIGNYLGVVKPIVELQEKGLQMMVFVADLHGLTTHEPAEVKSNVRNVLLDYMALGLDPAKTEIFVQSHIARELSYLTLILSRHTTVAELLRVPTLKDKIKHGQNAETATAFLLFYPVLQAADILMMRAKTVPVGEDQVAHVEICRELARRFNKTYGEVFSIPRPSTTPAARILSLKGDSKMSKSYPEGALFLTDDEATIRAKIKRAETADAGLLTPNLLSLFEIAKGLSETTEQRKYFKTLLKRHEQQETVMGEFKASLAEVTVDFVKKFQERRHQLESNPDYLERMLRKGNQSALQRAQETMALVGESQI